MNYRFGLTGAAGYVAPRHMKAIKDTGCDLSAALDKNDSVGIIDSYFPDAKFFTEFERFDRHLEKEKRKGLGIDYLSICSPNYLHDAHCRLGLRTGADVICEKPLVLNPWNIDALQEVEADYNKKIYNILQLRLHDSIIALKEKVDSGDPNKIYDVDLAYFTSRGKWYHVSWKGDNQKSGGIATNIGVHFFDMLSWIFGDIQKSVVHRLEGDIAAGYLELKRARVRWILSINYDFLPEPAKEKGMRTYRSITVGDEEIEFSGGFTELHTRSYQHIMDGHGFGIGEVKNCIKTVYDIRNSTPIGLSGDYHPLAGQV
ncbi:MAG: Gfo/Idh/MocA family oxidoreductase [Saprospiraceae bacterium]